MTDRQHLEYLLKRFAAGQASDKEVDELFYLLRQGEWDEELKTSLQQMVQETEGKLPYQAEQWEPFIQQVLQSDPQVHTTGKSRKMYAWRWAAAAAVILLIGSGLYFLLPRHKAEQTIAVKPALVHDLAPGSTAAILTIAGGKHILLDSMAKGVISRQGSTEIMNAGGRLSYQGRHDSSAGRNTTETLYNTLATNKGNQYQLVLPDGSKVWLNAASSITYPVAFTGNERKVEITGEAYFEVVHNDRMPFRVKAGNEIIEDLGTQFNVNAYTDEPSMKTTLLEGSVKINGKVLKPGEQASISNGKMALLKSVNLEDVVAWKNGRFRFSSVDIETILRQAARWYDVEIEYRGKVNGTISGGISRNVNASQLLHILELTGKLQFEIEGKKIIVKPKS